MSGKITVTAETDVEGLRKKRNATAVLDLGNGRTFSVTQEWFSGPGGITTDEGELEVAFQGLSARFD